MEDPSKPNFFERLINRITNDAPESAEEVVDILRQAHDRKVYDAETLQRLEKILDFNELEVRDAMITRAQMNVIKSGDSLERIVAYIIETAHSRFPVISEDKDNVLGILHAKDLLRYAFSNEYFNLESILRPAVFVPEGMPLNMLLKAFREQRNHMAVVIDEYGGVSGLVTFEDLIEEILGDIEDEFDEDDSADNIFAVSEGRWRINAFTEVEDINDYFGTDYDDEEADTIGGLVIQELGRLPVRGEKVTLGKLQFTVARADNRRLHTLMATKIREE
ncbi:HlyC/CorC family transporter [Neisseria wadsworthii]|uniref:Magnesium and cobalt efflux protein CorC n=1 Tax=Neisseria wadsworthii 9715 TaxID=1030841 RepID=G4CPC2_9NEIS|nr:transporter associated domain-containing protein [Neisseria wadsworthii]EGZ48036.1 magnesium and cobalt efflux protein CorC [Neisseria wadsworthii 9715]QMT34750.1 CBS domain-containing protein [Neisseria wadsworthii]